MKIGNKNPQSNIDYDTLEKIFEHTITTAVTSIDITGLSGNTDEQYMLDCRFVNGYNGGNNFYLLANNDSGTNYGTQNLVGSVTTVSANRSARTNFDIGYCSTVDYICQSNLVLHAKSGYVRTCLINIGRSITGTAVTDMIVTGSSWNNTADEITSLIIQSLNANGLGIGSSISLYRRITAWS